MRYGRDHTLIQEAKARAGRLKHGCFLKKSCVFNLDSRRSGEVTFKTADLDSKDLCNGSVSMKEKNKLAYIKATIHK